MHPRTIATLEQLRSAEWFSNTGGPASHRVITVSSWQEAIESCQSEEWQELLLEAANRYSEAVLRRSKERFRQWNDVAHEVKSATEPLVQQKIASVVEQNRLPKVFADTVSWDISHCCMESEYADVFEPGFFASQAFWYVNGRFPCGWVGSFPEGRLRIY